MAYVLAIVVIGASLTGAAAFGTAGAIGLLTPDSPRPSIVINGPTSSPEPSFESSEPAESSEPSDSLEPSESPSSEPSQSSPPEDTARPAATATPRSSDDHSGESPSPSASDDQGDHPSSSPGFGGESGGSASTQSPRPSDTPKPSD